jgi:hypothetical protein
MKGSEDLPKSETARLSDRAWIDTQRDDEDYVFGREADKAFWPNTVRKRT